MGSANVAVAAPLVKTDQVGRALRRIDTQLFRAKIRGPLFEASDELATQSASLKSRFDRELTKNRNIRMRVPLAVPRLPTRRQQHSRTHESRHQGGPDAFRARLSHPPEGARVSFRGPPHPWLDLERSLDVTSRMRAPGRRAPRSFLCLRTAPHRSVDAQEKMDGQATDMPKPEHPAQSSFRHQRSKWAATGSPARTALRKSFLAWHSHCACSRVPHPGRGRRGAPVLAC
jgi:hypothetical protein